MSVRLSSLKAKVAEATVEWQDEVIPFGYRPAAFTIALADDLEAEGEKDDLGSVAAMLEPIMEWWDVLDDDDQRIPPTAVNMRQFPVTFLTAIMSKITEDMDPPAKPV